MAGARQPASRVVGVLYLPAFLLALGTLLGFAGLWHWSLDLFSHFRLQYAIGLVTVALLLAGTGRRGQAAVLGAFAAVNLWLLWPPLDTAARAVPAGGPATLRVMLQNLNTSFGDPQRVLALIRRENPDLLVLQEVDGRWLAELAPLENVYPYRVLEPRAGNFGMALYSRFRLAGSSVIRLSGSPLPSIETQLVTPWSRIRVVATHPPPPLGREGSRLRNAMLRDLSDRLDEDRPTLVIGDLNVTRWSPHFRRLLRRSGLRDSASGFAPRPTWWPRGMPLLAIPIDHLLHSRGLRVVDRRIGPPVASDHRALIVDLTATRAGTPLRASQGPPKP